MQSCCIDIVKGYTRASVIALVLMTAAELDLDTEWDLVLPLVPFLDRAWLLPCHVTYLDLMQVFGSLGFDFKT